MKNANNAGNMRLLWTRLLVGWCLVIPTRGSQLEVVTDPNLRRRLDYLPRNENDIHKHRNVLDSQNWVRNGRSLATDHALATANCNSVRLEDYKAELQLVYSYSVEFAKGGSRRLDGLEQAIAHSIANELDDCDLLDRPLYKVKTNTKHVLSKDEFCPPLVDGDTCQVVTGATVILLDSKSAHVKEEAYAAIAKGLNNTEFVQQFATSVVRAQFLEPLRQSLVTPRGVHNPSSPGTVTATVAVAAASVSFIVASIFCYGLMRREMRNHPEPSVRHKNRIKKGSPSVVSNPIGIKRRKHFVRLEDFATSSANRTAAVTAHSFVVPQPRDYTPSITWSVSDLTSDSASLRSSVSRTTSKLERIEEEDEPVTEEHCYSDPVEEETEDEPMETWESCSPAKFSVSGVEGLPISPIQITEVRDGQGSVGKADIPQDVSGLVGCQYVEEGVRAESLQTCHLVKPKDEDAQIDLSAVMPDVDDLQIRLDVNEDKYYFEAIPSILTSPSSNENSCTKHSDRPKEQIGMHVAPDISEASTKVKRKGATSVSTSNTSFHSIETDDSSSGIVSAETRRMDDRDGSFPRVEKSWHCISSGQVSSDGEASSFFDSLTDKGVSVVAKGTGSGITTDSGNPPIPVSLDIAKSENAFGRNSREIWAQRWDTNHRPRVIHDSSTDNTKVEDDSGSQASQL